jgi:hypothetical protein
MNLYMGDLCRYNSIDGAINKTVSFELFLKNDDSINQIVYLQCHAQDIDPLLFAIMLPCGDLGWTCTMLSTCIKKIPALKYYGYRFSYRSMVSESVTVKTPKSHFICGNRQNAEIPF